MELTIEEALQQGVAAHREGRLEAAERLYRAILQAQPGHPDANHNLGVLSASLNKHDVALPLFKTALEANPKIEQFWLSYIEALIKEQHFVNATQVFEQAKARGVLGDNLNYLEAQLASKSPAAHLSSASTPETELTNLLRLYHNARYSDAEKLAVTITRDFPEHPLAWKVLGAVLAATGRQTEALAVHEKLIALTPNDAEAHNNRGSALQSLGRLEEAEASYRVALNLNPDLAIAHNNLAVTLQKLGRLNESESSCIAAVALKPDLADAHNTLGVTLKLMGRLNESEVSCNKAIALKPDFADAHSNLGITLKQLGRLDEAEVSYRQAIALKPGHADAHNNLGVTLKQLGRLNEAEASYNQAIALNPDFGEATHNLIDLLTFHIPKTTLLQPIVNAHNRIRELDEKEALSGFISDEKIIYLINRASDIVKDHNLDLWTYQCQIYRRNSIDLNCDRHKDLFQKFNLIPKFCFGCYKVQIEPRSILELLKLFVVFDQIKLPGNNTRKCMIEMRPIVSGFYKGLIYCSSLEEADRIAENMAKVVEERIGPEVSVVVKRGCSEYPISYPDYAEINKSGPQLMQYNEEWALIEDGYDAKHSIKNQKIISPTLSFLSLSDVLIMRNWIDYAIGIGDSSALLLRQSWVGSQEMYDIAKTRLERHSWRESREAL